MPKRLKNSLLAGLVFVVVAVATWTGTSPPVWGQRSWEIIHIFDGQAPDDWLGHSVSGTGDVDNDGYDDVIVGAH